MYKNNAEKLFQKSDFLRDLLSSNRTASFPIRSQMPSHQINYFLKQASSRKKHITIQLNKSALSSQIREATGVIMNGFEKNNQLFLTDKNKISIVPIEDIRHIRLSN